VLFSGDSFSGSRSNDFLSFPHTLDFPPPCDICFIRCGWLVFSFLSPFLSFSNATLCAFNVRDVQPWTRLLDCPLDLERHFRALFLASFNTDVGTTLIKPFMSPTIDVSLSYFFLPSCPSFAIPRCREHAKASEKPSRSLFLPPLVSKKPHLFPDDH